MSVSGKTAQVMDSKTYEVYDIDIPDEFVKDAAAGKEADILEAMGKRMIERIK
jgi:translation elongation factor P/translation initiation factor 5A